MEQDEDPVEEKRRQKNERQRKWLAKQSPEKLASIRAARAASQRRHRARLTPERAAASRAANAKYQRRHRERQTPEEAAASRAANTKAQQRRRKHLTPEQAAARRAANTKYQQRHRQHRTPEQVAIDRATNAAAHRLCKERSNEAESKVIRDEAINVKDQLETHNCGPFNIICQFCKSKNFIAERPSDGMFTSCCRKGKVKLPKHKDANSNNLPYPEFLRKLLSDTTNPSRIHFRENIRSYNSAVSFASLGAKIVEQPGRGPYVFKVHGQTYHKTSHLQPLDDKVPQYAQLYVLDSTQATDIRLGHVNDLCRREILDQIDQFFRENNRLAQSYQLMREVETREVQRATQTGEKMPLISMSFRCDRQSDQLRHNASTSNEVAMIFVNEDGEPPFERDIRIYPKNPEDPNQLLINLH